MTTADRAIWMRLAMHLKSEKARACEAIDALSMTAHSRAPDSPAAKAFVQHRYGNDTVRRAVNQTGAKS